MFSRRCAPAVFLFLVSSLYSQTSAPNPSAPTPTFKAKVRVVLLDVVVTAGKDEPVLGLKKKDFEVFENGKPQSISTFEEHKSAPLTQIKLPPMPPGIYTNFPIVQTSDSVNVLLLDSLNTQPQDQAYVNAQVIKYLQGIRPGTRLAIFTLASRLRMLLGFSTDSGEILAGLKSTKNGGLKPQISPLLPSASQVDTDEEIVSFMKQNKASPAAIAAVRQFQQDKAAFDAGSRIEMTLQALQQLARYLSSIPGRKNIIWFASSFPITIFPGGKDMQPIDAMRRYQEDIRQTADLLTPEQVAIYPISATGLEGNAAYEEGHSTSPQQQEEDLREESETRAANQSAMEELARDTGGHAFYNTNGLGDAMVNAVNDGTWYYTLTYTPADKKMNGKYRSIQVKLPDNKYKLAYRRGYYAEDAKTAAPVDAKQPQDPLWPLLGFGLPDFSQIVYKIRVLPSIPQPPPDAARIGSNRELKGPITRYSVDFAISVQDLKFDITPDGLRHGDIEMMMIAYDHDGKPVNMTVRKAGIRLRPDAYNSFEQIGLPLQSEIDVPKGDTFLRTGVFDLGSNTAGTIEVPLSDGPVQSSAKK
ncbi:MAG TPA: VWA domain-containing protein [Terriglobales bacterium]|jgi:VWFA-related protein